MMLGDAVSLPQWAAGPSLALVVIIIYGTWTFIGFNTVIFMAGLGSIPRELYEAASIDGAGRWPQFRHITLALAVADHLFPDALLGHRHVQSIQPHLRPAHRRRTWHHGHCQRRHLPDLQARYALRLCVCARHPVAAHHPRAHRRKQPGSQQESLLWLATSPPRPLPSTRSQSPRLKEPAPPHQLRPHPGIHLSDSRRHHCHCAVSVHRQRLADEPDRSDRRRLAAQHAPVEQLFARVERGQLLALLLEQRQNHANHRERPARLLHPGCLRLRTHGIPRQGLSLRLAPVDAHAA